jgi:hypothetical protein
MCCYAVACRCPNRFSRRGDEIVPRLPYRICPYTPASLLSPRLWGYAQRTSECICELPVKQPPQQTSTIIPYTDEKRGNISRVSFGETGGLYPTKNGQKGSLYQPKDWDEQMTAQLLKCRAAITLVAGRGERHKTALPNTSNAVERMLAAYHLTDNFPPVDIEIASDPTVRFFFLSPKKDAKHTGLNYDNWDVKMVKAYGPFYNVGGGDVPKGPTYVLFYSVKPKQKGK